MLVKLSKERYRYAIDACQAEFAAVTINKTSRHTVAVESTEPEDVPRVIGQLGIQDLVNMFFFAPPCRAAYGGVAGAGGP